MIERTAAVDLLTDLKNQLEQFLLLPSETEWLEFKEAKTTFSMEDLGKYFSALSNEANLKRKEFAWLILGVSDKLPRQPVGTAYRNTSASLDSLKKEVADHTTNRLTFDEIFEISLPQRVLMFRIPPASKGIPTSWKGHFYGREGESLAALSMSELEQIRNQVAKEDWSAKICTNANFSDLDREAVSFARQQYKSKNSNQAGEIDGWDDLTFLNKAKLCVAGQITNAALILLGKTDSSHLILPALAQITWVLKDANGTEKDYEHFGMPFILAVGNVYEKIRNLTYRHLADQSLFPHEVQKYEPWVIRESLNNCIAHQDYSKAGRITVVEEEDSLIFNNLGHFLPDSVEEVIRTDSPPAHYRNPFLAQAMVNLNMIDTIGSGIKRMFRLQRERYFPLPDYDLSDTNQVKVRLFGKVLDENYTRILIKFPDLTLGDVIALDKVQKKKSLSDEEFDRLKAAKLIEGRRPNLYVSARVAAVVGSKANYIKNLALDKQHYKQLVISYLEKFGEAKREDLEKLLLNKISDALTEKQKINRVKNILQEMRRENFIHSVGIGKSVTWRLSNYGEGK